MKAPALVPMNSSLITCFQIEGKYLAQQHSTQGPLLSTSPDNVSVLGLGFMPLTSPAITAHPPSPTELNSIPTMSLSSERLSSAKETDEYENMKGASPHSPTLR